MRVQIKLMRIKFSAQQLLKFIVPRQFGSYISSFDHVSKQCLIKSVQV